MKRIFYLFVFALLSVLTAQADRTQLGVPYFVNYTATDYSGNNRNSDVLVDDNGFVFVANFEGLLYFDQASWKMTHLKSLTRPTALYRDSKGTIWVGGYNYFGHISVKSNGTFELNSVEKEISLLGEVVKIWEENGSIAFLLTNDSVYGVQGNHLKHIRTDVSNDNTNSVSFPEIDVNITHVLTIDNGLKAVATTGKGLFLYDETGLLICNISEKNGLCSNNINRLAYNGKGTLWGATENGLFAMSIPSAYSHFGQDEKLHGEVYSIRRFAGRIYVGTTSGLYRQSGLTFEHISNVNHLCWNMEEFKGSLLIASEGGLYMVAADGTVSQLNNHETRALLVKDDIIYTGESDGVYLNKLNEVRYNVCKQPNVTRILTDGDDCMWLQTLYGEIFYRKANLASFSQYTKDITKVEDISMTKATLVRMEGEKVLVVDALDEEPFPYPQFSYTDKDGLIWLTDKTYTNLYAWKDGERCKEYDRLVYPLRNQTIRCMWTEGKRIWMGGTGGVVVVDRIVKDPSTTATPNLRITSVVVNGDSILWGGIGVQPKELNDLKSSERNLLFNFALDFTTVYSSPLYQYRLDEEEWSKPSEVTSALFNNVQSGKHVFQVKAVDATGNETKVISISFFIRNPFYLRWYMIILYVLLTGVCFVLLMRWRTQRLEKEKQHLESIVGERTAEVVKQRDEIVKQKDEIEEKSKSLESALTELSQAQHELIQQEKMATVGKLTQGLIDRILNPLNYINNFSKLSQGLVKDVEANIDDEKDNMNEDNYEDTKDVLNMLSMNLGKVSDHGQSTTRTLKAMEEMLKDRTGGIVPMDLTVLIRQDEEMLKTYFSKQISECGIKVSFPVLSDEIRINGNADQLSKSFMSILGNSVYALEKKMQRTEFIPEVTVSVKEQSDIVEIVFRDNGVGIEDTIINKIFDPFFTTKTTAEASGVGLYLCREIILSHQGSITVASEKNKFTEFTIILPKIK